jgi:hypothetical protein
MSRLHLRKTDRPRRGTSPRGGAGRDGEAMESRTSGVRGPHERRCDPSDVNATTRAQTHALGMEKDGSASRGTPSTRALFVSHPRLERTTRLHPERLTKLHIHHHRTRSSQTQPACQGSPQPQVVTMKWFIDRFVGSGRDRTPGSSIRIGPTASQFVYLKRVTGATLVSTRS